MLPLFGIMNMMKIIQYQICWKYMDIKCDLMVLNASRHVPFIWNKMLKFRTCKTICNHDVYKSKKVIIISYSSFKNINNILFNSPLSF